MRIGDSLNCGLNATSWSNSDSNLGIITRTTCGEKAQREILQRNYGGLQFRSVQFSRSVVSDSLRPHELQLTRLPCPSPSPGVHSNLRPSSWWRHPAISSSVVPFSSCPQSLPASESFPMSQLFAWGGQRTRVSALASFLPKKSQGWSPLEWTGWIYFANNIYYQVPVAVVWSQDLPFVTMQPFWTLTNTCLTSTLTSCQL